MCDIFTVAELQQFCSVRKLSTSGTALELAMRLENVYKFRIDFGCLWCCQWGGNLATAQFPERLLPHTIPVCDMSRWADACRGQ